jgi:hypothetical protein
MILSLKTQKSQRLFPRYKVNYDLKYSYNKKLSKCEIINISEGGMLLKIPQILDAGDQIRLFFDEYNNSDLHAVIKHKNHNYVGINFINNSDDDYNFIRQFIKEIKSKNRFY